MEIGMIKTILRRNKQHSIITISILLSLLGCVYIDKPLNAKTVESRKMNALQKTIWEIIDSAPKLYPFSKVKIEQLLSTKLIEKDSSENYSFLESKSNIFLLKDNNTIIEITEIDFRVNKTKPENSIFILNFNTSTNCVNFAEVQSKYKNLIPEPPPSPPPLDPSRPNDIIHKWHAPYTSIQPWGKLRFSFETIGASFEPQCLEYVSFGIKR